MLNVSVKVSQTTIFIERVVQQPVCLTTVAKPFMVNFRFSQHSAEVRQRLRSDFTGNFSFFS